MELGVDGAREPVNPTVRRWQLTEALRQLRLRSGMTIEQAAHGLSATGTGKWSRSKLGRIETREQHVHEMEVIQLLDLYGVEDTDVRTWFLQLAATAAERGYWHAIRRDLPEDFHGLLDVESSLVAMCQLEMLLVPGLLQTADYTRALIRGAESGLSAEAVERRVLARGARQQILSQANRPRYHVIMDETVMERPVGNDAVMRSQMRRIVDDANAGRVTIQVLSKSVGASPALDGPFSILTLPDPIPAFGYAEGTGGATYIEDPEDVQTCVLKWDILVKMALSPDKSISLIEEQTRIVDDKYGGSDDR